MSVNINDLLLQDLFVLLDLLGAANPKISNYQKASDQQFKHLASIEEKLVDRGLLSPDVPKVFHFKENFGVWGRPRISDDHLPFLRRGQYTSTRNRRVEASAAFVADTGKLTKPEFACVLKGSVASS